MTYPGNNQHPGKESTEKDQFVIGADVIAILTSVKYPMIMVDKVVSYYSEPLSLVAEKYISANEPAFTGHFPNMKLWPGVYTIEGLRQSCFILYVLNELEKAGLIKGVLELQNRQILRPLINHKLCQDVIDHLKEQKLSDPDLFSMRMKFLEPVFAGSLIKYHCSRDEDDLQTWSVKAVVAERIIAKGELRLPL
jgi:3-hydroxymyristoyl/3-hydroxydecanoyl-(acyl carrier protein) dehydratase